MKVAILGAGNGGCATAVDMAIKGFDTTLCSAYRPEHSKNLIKRGGIEYSGQFGEGFVRIKATNSVKEAVEVSDIIIITTPSTIHETYAKLLAPHLLKKQLILLCGCNTGSALNVANILRKMGVSDSIVCETDILSYICRLQSPTHIKIYHRINHLLFSAFPAKYNDKSYEIAKELYPEIELVENVLETSLSNLNAIIHPPGMVLNAGWIEAHQGKFFFYSQGITSSVARTIEQVDLERLTILRKMSMRQLGVLDHLRRIGFCHIAEGSVYDAIQASEPVRGIKAPTELNNRYFTEDIGYGLVPMAYMARNIGVLTPTIDSLINLACILNEVNYWKAGLTQEKLGIKKIGLKQLKRYLYEGLHQG